MDDRPVIPTKITHPELWRKAEDIKAAGKCECDGPDNIQADGSQWCPCACLSAAAGELGIIE